MTVIDSYLSKIAPEKREQLERIRKIARETVPEAEETISYGMPTLKYKNQAFLGFNAHTKHIGIYPYGSEEITLFKNKLSAFSFSPGAIRVAFDKSFPEDLLVKIIKHRIGRIKQ